jgi:hypothetical protein
VIRKLKTTKPIRQGDVLFTRISRLPKGKRTKRASGVVAYGEVTGHSHALAFEDRGEAEVLEISDGLFVRVSEHGVSGVIFQHEEHGPVTLPPGNYRIVIQREYSPEAIRNVVD